MVIFSPVLEILVPLLLLIILSSIARYIHLIFFERCFKLTFEDAPVWSLFYFGFWTAVVVILFPVQTHYLFASISVFGYFLLASLLLVIFPAIFLFLRKYIGDPKWLSELFPGQGMLSLEERYIIAKIGDVIFQQSIAGVIVLLLVAQGLEYPQIVAIFLPIFLLAHLYIFRTSGFVWGIHYSAYAALGGFAFPFLIIFVPTGIAYAIVFHMLFYVLSAAFFAKLPYPHATIRKHIA
jgi:hypothetical protein